MVKSEISSDTSALNTTNAVIGKILQIFTENKNIPLSVEELTQNLVNTSAEASRSAGLVEPLNGWSVMTHYTLKPLTAEALSTKMHSV